MAARRHVAVVTGSRAEYGLLRPVMRAIGADPRLELHVIVAGAHLLGPDPTEREVAREFPIAATIPMQVDDEIGRLADAAAVGRGVTGFAARLAARPADFVVVLGDRIEAFAAAAAASVGGVRVAHLHGGDRAEGIADEALRGAVTRLAHLHLPATACSARRLEAAGEDPRRIHLVGSPAIDDLAGFGPLSDARFTALGEPEIVLLLHPVGRADGTEQAGAERLAGACRAAGRVLWLHPNHDPGRAGILRAMRDWGSIEQRGHLPRADFVGLLRRCRVLAGNSSAGLIEAAALGVPAVNVRRRQDGRERAANVIDVPEPTDDALARALADALARGRPEPSALYGDGRTGPRVADLLASVDLADCPLAKRNAY